MRENARRDGGQRVGVETELGEEKDEERREERGRRRLGTLNPLLEGLFDILLGTVFLHKHVRHNGVSTAILLPPLLDGRGYLPSVGLHLVLVVLDLPLGDHAVIIEANAEPLLVPRLLGESRKAPASGRAGELLPSVTFRSAGDHNSQSFLHLRSTLANIVSSMSVNKTS